VLGAMKELGNETGDMHSMITRRAADSSVDLVFLVGDEYAKAFEMLPDGARDRFRWFSSVEDLLPGIKDTVKTGDIVLVKGSRDTSLERITDYIV